MLYETIRETETELLFQLDGRARGGGEGESCNYFEINLRPGWKGGIVKYARFPCIRFSESY